MDSHIYCFLRVTSSDFEHATQPRLYHSLIVQDLICVHKMEDKWNVCQIVMESLKRATAVFHNLSHKSIFSVYFQRDQVLHCSEYVTYIFRYSVPWIISAAGRSLVHFWWTWSLSFHGTAKSIFLRSYMFTFSIFTVVYFNIPKTFILQVDNVQLQAEVPGI